VYGVRPGEHVSWFLTMAARGLRFEVYRHGGEFWFRLVGRDGAPLLFSGPQACLAGCLEVVAEIKAVGHTSARYRIRTSPAGTEYFTIHGVLGDVLATSRLYQSRRKRDAAEHFLREHVVDAPVEMPDATSPTGTAQAM
jgi:hypothetical protein